MQVITEEQYNALPYNGCEFVVKAVLDDDTEHPVYLLLDNEYSLREKMSEYFRNIHRKYESARYEYFFKPSRNS
jgi:hypothetical protein